MQDIILGAKTALSQFKIPLKEIGDDDDDGESLGLISTRMLHGAKSRWQRVNTLSFSRTP